MSMYNKPSTPHTCPPKSHYKTLLMTVVRNLEIYGIHTMTFILPKYSPISSDFDGDLAGDFVGDM